MLLTGRHMGSCVCITRRGPFGEGAVFPSFPRPLWILFHSARLLFAGLEGIRGGAATSYTADYSYRPCSECWTYFLGFLPPLAVLEVPNARAVMRQADEVCHRRNTLPGPAI